MLLQVADPITTSAPPSNDIPPAVLEGTPSTFPIAPEELLTQAKKVFHETRTGITDDSVLADDFRFEFPVVSLDRSGYLKAVRSFGLGEALPDLDSHP